MSTNITEDNKIPAIKLNNEEDFELSNSVAREQENLGPISSVPIPEKNLNNDIPEIKLNNKKEGGPNDSDGTLLESNLPNSKNIHEKINNTPIIFFSNIPNSYKMIINTILTLLILFLIIILMNDISCKLLNLYYKTEEYNKKSILKIFF